MSILNPRTWGTLTRWAVGTAAVLLLVAAGWTGHALLQPSLDCAPGVQKRGPQQECTGVSDGGFSFAPALDDVSRRIKAENDRIAGRPHATVAFMVSMVGASDVTQQQILREIQGAYLAQYRENRDNNLSPAIRLVLANPGSGGAQWRSVADQLGTMARSATDNLRAVAGFDTSVNTTKEAIGYLTNTLRIPVIGGLITADDIANSDEHPSAFPGLARVVPTNTQVADTLATYVGKRATPSTTKVVEDLREDDNYIKSLRVAFGKHTSLPSEQFRSPGDILATGNLSNDFQQMVSSLCTSKVETIYFAGRYTQLRQFLNELGKRGCRDKTFTVVTGDAADTLASDPEFNWEILKTNKENGRIVVQYAAVANSAMWDQGETVNGGSKDELTHLTAELDKQDLKGFGPVDFRGSRTMIAHDSVRTAVAAIRKAAVLNPIPGLQDTRDKLLRLHGDARINGTSGWICLDNNGNPDHKALAVVELDPEAPTKEKAIRVKALTWAGDSPPEPDCPTKK
ncbi:hypothetical protein KCMC57_up00880 [Kitasatospora sp. CMC57]|uniref:Uncharacterized protein n=1 Tax=Kitasatospora sp. CMC57 TaxID=3231513 RepID=A0AB33JK39_9ACTN